MLSLFTTLDLSRFQFAMTTIFHFFFVPLSIGLAVVIAVMETMYVIKKNPVYRKMAQFWGKIFLLSFAVGIPTGIIQEFQFGMNWSEYSRYVGDIFGAPLAVEALVAFFAESTFIGLWMFTWDRFKPAVHAVLIWVVAFGTMISALWILAANSFMQNPVAYTLNSGKQRLELTDFGALLSNKQLWYEFPHVIFGALITGAFVVLGLSAFRLLKSKTLGAKVTDFYRKSLTIGAVIGLLGSVGAIWSGDLQTNYVAQEQPMKFAAMEGVDRTVKASDRSDNSQPWTLLGVWNKDTKEFMGKVEIPYALSILKDHSMTGGETKGMVELNEEFNQKFGENPNGEKDYYVPVNTVFYSFRVMAFGAGFLSLVSLLALFFNRKKGSILKQKWLLWVAGLTTFLPFIINTAGWLVTELGRYPWTVYGIFTMADSVSPTATVTSLLISNTVYFLSFGLMGILMIVFSYKTMQKGPEDVEYDNFAKPKANGSSKSTATMAAKQVATKATAKKAAPKKSTSTKGGKA